MCISWKRVCKFYQKVRKSSDYARQRTNRLYSSEKYCISSRESVFTLSHHVRLPKCKKCFYGKDPTPILSFIQLKILRETCLEFSLIWRNKYSTGLDAPNKEASWPMPSILNYNKSCVPVDPLVLWKWSNSMNEIFDWFSQESNFYSIRLGQALPSHTATYIYIYVHIYIYTHTYTYTLYFMSSLWFQCSYLRWN